MQPGGLSARTARSTSEPGSLMGEVRGLPVAAIPVINAEAAMRVVKTFILKC